MVCCAVAMTIAHAVGTCIWRFGLTVLQWSFSLGDRVSYCPSRDLNFIHKCCWTRSLASLRSKEVARGLKMLKTLNFRVYMHTTKCHKNNYLFISIKSKSKSVAGSLWIWQESDQVDWISVALWHTKLSGKHVWIMKLSKFKFSPQASPCYPWMDIYMPLCGRKPCELIDWHSAYCITVSHYVYAVCGARFSLNFTPFLHLSLSVWVFLSFCNYDVVFVLLKGGRVAENSWGKHCILCILK